MKVNLPALHPRLKWARASLRREVRRAADSTEDESTERHLREMLGGDSHA